ncbi:MAG: ABC transporter substrate-binding protein, partial [Anaerolineae bacterium]
PELVIVTEVVEIRETVVVEQTRIVEAEPKEVTVVETVEVVVTAEPEPTEVSLSGQCCDVYRIGLWDAPSTTNYWSYLGPDALVTNSYVLGGSAPSLYGLADVTFQFVPYLARDLIEPVDNGDGTWTITVPIVDGALWSDGQPITCHDLAFTFNTCKDLKLTINWPTQCKPNELEATVECPDDYNVRFTFLNQAPSLGTWQAGLALAPILPEHFWADAVADAYAFIEGLEEPTVEMPEGVDCRLEELSEEERTACQPYLAAWDPYNEAFENARRTLYGADGIGAPSGGGYVTDKLDPGAFVQRTANEQYYFKGAEIVEYEDGTWLQILPDGTRRQLYGDAQGAETLRYTVGPHAPKIILSVYGSQEAAFLALVEGDVDYVLNSAEIPRGIREMVEDRGEDIETYVNEQYGMYYLAFNLRKAPMSEPAFRQAVDILLDKEFIIDQVLGGIAYPLYSTMPPGNVFWHNPEVPRPYVGWSREERVNEAVRVLKQGGWSWAREPAWDEDLQDVVAGQGLTMPNGEPVPEITLLGAGPTGDAVQATFSQWTGEWMRELDIPVKTELTGVSSIIGPVFVEADFDMYVLGWALGNVAFPDYFQSFWHSRNDTAVSGNNNSTGFSNAEYDALMDEFMGTPDLERARELIFEAQILLADQRPYIPLYYGQTIDMARSNLVFPYTESLGGLELNAGLQTETRPLYR